MTSEYNCCLLLVTCVESEAANHLDLAFVYQGYIECTVISVNMPTLIFTVNMPNLFLRAVFSKFFGRRCLVEGLVREDPCKDFRCST